MTRFSAILPLTLLLSPWFCGAIAAVSVAGVTAYPAPAAAGLLKKIKKQGRKAAGKVAGPGEKVTDRIGDAAHDDGIAIGKQVSKSGGRITRDLTRKGRTIGRVVIEGGRIVETETVEGGRVIARETEAGGKFIVSGSAIVGREIVVAGRTVGQSVIRGGRVVGHTAIQGSGYVVRAGEIVLDGLTRNVCRKVAGAVTSGSKIDLPAVPGVPGLPDFESLVAEMAKNSAREMTKLSGDRRGKIIRGAADAIGEHAGAVPGLKNMAKTIDAKRKEVAALFAPDVFCNASVAEFERRLTAIGLAPDLAGALKKKAGLLDDLLQGRLLVKQAQAKGGRHFFYAYNFSAAAAGGSGGVMTLSIILDFRGHGGAYATLGPQVVSNVTAGVSMGPTYFTSVSVDDLEGWGWSIAISGGPPTKVLSGSVDIAMDETFRKFQGFGTSGAVGLGVIPGDVAFARTRTWKMN